MVEAVEEAIHKNALGPRRAQGDSGSVEHHNLEDRIDVDRYLASGEAAKKGLGVGMTNVVPPGAV